MTKKDFAESIDSEVEDPTSEPEEEESQSPEPMPFVESPVIEESEEETVISPVISPRVDDKPESLAYEGEIYRFRPGI